MNRKYKIEKILMDNFEPYFFLVKDVSEEHRGHQNFRENVESHFEILIVSQKFEDLNNVARHRMINKLLEEEFMSDLHSVTMKTLTIDEYEKA